MRQFLKLALLSMLMAASLPLTAQQLLDLHGKSTPKTAQPVSADIKATIPMRDVSNGDHSVTVTYTFTNALLSDDPLYEGSKWWKVAGFGFENRVTKPSVPQREDLVEIPKGSDYKLTLVSADYTEFSFELTPAHPELRNDLTQGYTKDNVLPIDPKLGLFPDKIVEDNGIQTYRGVDMVQVKVCPVQYDPESKKVRAYTKICYRVDYDGDPVKYEDFETPEYAEYALDHEFTDNITVNPSNIGLNDNPESATLKRVPNFQDYLILTVPEYKEEVKWFAEWKELLGFTTHVISRDDWTVENVKQTVEDMYASLRSLRYLLIVGDYDDVPAKTYSKVYLGNTVVSDLQYGCMDGNDDLVPDIHRGRISVSSKLEAQTVLTKIVNYEFFPEMTTNFYNKGIHCTHFQDEDSKWTKRDGYEDRRFVRTCEDIRDALIKHGKTVERIYKADVSDGIYPTNWDATGSYSNGEPIPDELKYPQFAWDGDTNDIINAINEGASYVLHRDHGTFEGWHSPYFKIENVDRLTNKNKLPVVFSLNCLTGKFDTNVCFAEKLLRHPNGGCVAIYAASGRSYSGYNDVLAGGMFDAVWPDEDLHIVMPKYSDSGIKETPEPTYMLGQILDQGFARMEEVYGVNERTTTYTKLLFHCFGDPSMRMRTKTPGAWRSFQVERDSTGIKVRPGIKSTITFYDLTNNKMVSYLASDITLQTDHADNVTVCVSAPNQIPIIDRGQMPDSPIKNKASKLLACDSRPGNTTATFAYNIGLDACDANIDIADMYGNKRLSVKVDASLSSVTTDIGGLKPGIYIATLIVDGIITDSIKFIVS